MLGYILGLLQKRTEFYHWSSMYRKHLKIKVRTDVSPDLPKQPEIDFVT